MKTPNRIVGSETDTELLAQSAGEFSHEPAEKQAGPVEDGLVSNSLARRDVNRGRAKIAFAAMLALSAACASGENTQDAPPEFSAAGHSLALRDLNPPPAPLVLPLANGARTRVSQHGGGSFSHRFASTRHAVDFATDGLALTPVGGKVKQKPNNAGWGNTVELEGQDGHLYVFAHCRNFTADAPNNAFVLKGAPVCQIGTTGNSNGVHLHFDRVKRISGQTDPYESLGVPSYITMVAGEPEPSIKKPDDSQSPNANFSDCCYGQCTTAPGDSKCREYISFNRPLKDVLHGFSVELKQRDARITRLSGDVVPYAPTSADQAWLRAYEAATLNVNGQPRQSYVFFLIGSPGGNGQRNPFIDTAYSSVYNPANGKWENAGWQTKIHTERFKNFDLWDLINTSLTPAERQNLRFTQNVQTYPNWSAQWELHGTTFNVNGESISAYLAVSKTNRGVRCGIYKRGENWSQWTWM